MTHSRTIDGELVRSSLSKILGSETFSRSERLRTFLDYVVKKEQEGLGHQLKGYTIGVDVFARTESFDPGGDPLVRVQAGKLRKLLQQYYTNEGAEDTIRIQVPVGGYVPVYEWQEQQDGGLENPAESHDGDSGTIGIPAADIAGNAASAGPWGRYRLASAGLLAVTVLNITALGLHATSRYLVPKEATAISSPSGYYREASALPRITVANNHTASPVSAPLADALRHATIQLASVELVSSFSQADALVRQDEQLDFILSISPADDQGGILLSLHHKPSGELVHSETVAEKSLHSVSERAFAASSFASHSLAVNSSVYAYADQNASSSRLMQCLKATQDYHLEKSRQTFQAAWGCQSELVPTEHPERFISELETLTSMAREREAGRLPLTGA